MLPRERLKQYGVDTLSIDDLLAIIIGSGSKDNNVFALASKIVNDNDPYDMLDLTYEELLKIKGIKEAKACKIIASIELAKRIFNYKRPDMVKLKDATSVYNYLKSYFLGKKQEEFLALYFDNQLKLIKRRTIGLGTSDSVTYQVGEILKYAFKYDSSFLIVAHNHPSGILLPSKFDDLVTKRLQQEMKRFDVVLLDHLIIGDSGYYSFASEHKI